MKKFLLMISMAALIAFSANSSARAMTAYQKEQCDTVISANATAAAGSGAVLAQAPGTDNAALIGILGALTLELASVFNLDLDLKTAGHIALIIFKARSKTLFARAASEYVAGWIPGIGNVLNAATAWYVVNSLGWDIARLFDEGVNFGDLLDIPGVQNGIVQATGAAGIKEKAMDIIEDTLSGKKSK